MPNGGVWWVIPDIKEWLRIRRAKRAGCVDGLRCQQCKGCWCLVHGVNCPHMHDLTCINVREESDAAT